jgi:acyl-CoA reductase-like NAD-dependent aldehyde dehydrogenase
MSVTAHTAAPEREAAPAPTGSKSIDTGRLAKRVRSMRLGAGLDYTYDMGSLISEEQLDTVNEDVIDAVANRLRAGTVNINEGYIAAWGSVDAGMGGMKDSGLGRRHGAEGIRKYTEEQTVAVQRLMPLAPPPLVGQRLWARLMSAGLRLLRRMPGL